MPSNYWIKLYHEILDDPKMGRLPDHLWRRCIELFLIAGDTHRDGVLPPVGDMAWRLRSTDAEVTETLEALAQVGIVECSGSDWVVTNFSKRQSRDSDVERSQRYRNAQRRASRSGNGKRHEAVTSRDVDTDIDKEKDVDVVQIVTHCVTSRDDDEGLPTGATADGLRAQISRAWGMARGGLVNSLDSERLSELEGEFTPEWVLDAIREANNGRTQGRSINLNFVAAILDRWRQEGRETPFDHMKAIREDEERVESEKTQHKLEAWRATQERGAPP